MTESKTPHVSASCGAVMRSEGVVVLPFISTSCLLTLTCLAAQADRTAAPVESQPGAVVISGFSRVVVLSTAGRRRRSLIRRDVVEAELVNGSMLAPRSGDSIQLVDGKTARWEEAELDPEGRVQHASLRNGYLAATVHVDREQVVLLRAKRHSFAVVNGRSLPGDPYGYGFVVCPILLHKGENSFLFRCNKGGLAVTLEEPRSGWMLLDGDPTLPDVVVGENDRLLGAAVVLNATGRWLDDVRLRVSVKHEGKTGKAAELDVPALPPLTSRKVAFSFEPPVGVSPDDSVTVRLEVARRDKRTPDAREFPLRVRTSNQSRRRTFVSTIDGSVQYYTVQPRESAKADPRPPALFLSLHGAGVKSQRQAECYKAKDWGDVVAPDNRRPYGFDWEDWGRIDAMEALDLAAKRLGSDPLRTYLTGHSMGGHGTWQIGAIYPDRFAAIAPSAGWVSFRSYVGADGQSDDDPVRAMLHRAGNSSNTLGLLRNYLQQGVYVLHGEKDDNVPVSEARNMREQLGLRHSNFSYYERPGAGHWWGNQCMDWPPLFDFFAQNERKPSHEVDRVDFVTVSPAISDRYEWVSVLSQCESMVPSRVSLALDRKARVFVGTTKNVRRLAIDLDRAFGGSLAADADVSIELDDAKLGPIAIESLPSRRLLLQFNEGNWQLAKDVPPSEKGPHRAGPFKEAFRNRVLLIVGTSGTSKENAWALSKARYDAETFWYRGNGSIDVVRDVAFEARATADRNVILYGNAETNSAWGRVLGQDCPLRIDRTGIAVGKKRLDGPDLALLAIYPRLGSEVASVGIIAGTGLRGCRTVDRLPIFVSGVGIPDWVVISSSMFTTGIEGIPAAGFFDHNWQIDEQQSAWRKSKK